MAGNDDTALLDKLDAVVGGRYHPTTGCVLVKKPSELRGLLHDFLPNLVHRPS